MSENPPPHPGWPGQPPANPPAYQPPTYQPPPAPPGQPPPPYQPPYQPVYQPPYAAGGYPEGYGAPAAGRPGGFWVRVLAYLIDAVILGIVQFILGKALSGGSLSSAVVVIDAIYFAVFWSSVGGGSTPGMRALGLRVIGADGGPISLGRAFLRVIGLYVAAIILLIGILMVAFTERKRGLHDMIAGTYVVHTR